MNDLANSCLILIDLQRGFFDPKWGKRNNPLLEKNIAALLGLYRECALPVVHVRHDSTEPDSPLRSGGLGYSFIQEALPRRGEEVFTKCVHGAFLGTGLEGYLHWKEILRPVFVGLTTDHCVSTSVRLARDYGFRPMVISDAAATFGRASPYGRHLEADLVHELALASLKDEFADVVTRAQLEVGINQFMLTKERSETVALKNLS